jgi:hypothetical protein
MLIPEVILDKGGEIGDEARSIALPNAVVPGRSQEFNSKAYNAVIQYISMC